MKKGKILGLSNTEDCMWYKFSPEDITLDLLDLIFDIYDKLYEDEENEIHSYQFHTKDGEMYFHKETKDFIAYFIFTKKTAHLILKKVRNWKKFDEQITKKFNFVNN